MFWIFPSPLSTRFLPDGGYNRGRREAEQMTVVYLDRVFLLNLLVDYLLLLATARLAGRPLRRGRLLLCAAGGGLYAVAVFLPGCGFLARPLWRLAAGAAMGLLAWRRERRPCRLTALFFLLSSGLAGLLLALGLAAGSPTALLSRVYYADVSWPLLLGAAATFALLLHLVFRQGARQEGGELMDVTISLEGRRQRLRALHDTGNRLRDPVSGQPVLVLEQEALDTLPPEVAELLRRNLPPEETLARLYRLDGSCRFSLLPYCSVGAPSGLLLSVRSDYVKIGRITYPRILLALSPGPVGDGRYQALWGGAGGREVRHGIASLAEAAAERPAG